jgi:hypothetical protein
MKRWMLAVLVVFSQCAAAQSQTPRQPTEEECLGLLAILPTFQIPEMKLYYENSPSATGKDIAQKLLSLADNGNKVAQFTYSNLVLTGYCVPQDVCTARKYREQSRGGATDWEKRYPIPPWVRKKYDEAQCR